MDKLNQFKAFVKTNPNLIQYVRNNEMSWQKFYEIYDLYGEDEKVWQDYSTKSAVEEVKNVTETVGFAEVFSWLKNIDMDSLQSGISNVERVIGVLRDFNKPDTVDKPKEGYKPRPLYKSFDD